MAELSRRLPELSDDAALVGLRGIAASIGDGHTFVVAPPRPKLPVEFCWFGEQLTVVRAAAAQRALIGARVTAIGEHSAAAVQRRLQGLIPQGENQGYILARSVELMREPQVLAALGIAPVFHFVDAGGRESVTTLAADEAPLLTAEAAPLSMQRMAEPFWFSRLADQDAVYVQFRSYTGLEANAGRLFETLAQRSADRLVVDLRQNGGGNFLAGRQWLLVPIELLGWSPASSSCWSVVAPSRPAWSTPSIFTVRPKRSWWANRSARVPMATRRMAGSRCRPRD